MTISSSGIMNCTQVTEPPYAERHVRWCERTVAQIMSNLLLDPLGGDRLLGHRGKAGLFAVLHSPAAGNAFFCMGPVGLRRPMVRRLNKTYKTYKSFVGAPVFVLLGLRRGILFSLPMRKVERMSVSAMVPVCAAVCWNV